MGQFIQTNGDYNIKTKEGGKITLDTGPNVGSVRVTGNLNVEGDFVYVQATNLDVEDNIITLNKGETGAGVTLEYSGIEIDRGTSDPASFIWNENINSWQIVSGPEGTYGFAESRLKLKEILTNSGTDSGDLLLIGSGTGVVKVLGTDNYETQVTHDDDVPNKKYVDDAIFNNPTFQIVSDNVVSSSRVIVTDKDTAGSLTYFSTVPGSVTTFGESAVSILVDATQVSQYYKDRITLFDVQIEGSEISTRLSLTNSNLKLSAQGSGKLEINTALQMQKYGYIAEGSYVSNYTIVFANDPEIGDTGLWYLNDNALSTKRKGEFISKNKALIFSMLF
jgi:hypothetical protein